MAAGEVGRRRTGLGRARPGGGRGFTYLAMLLAIAVLSTGLAAAGTLWSATADRQRAQELEWVGQQYVQAIASFYYSSPGNMRRFPPDLQALVRDPRFPFVRRHLRRIYLDPYSGDAQWGVVRAPDGGVMGVYSLRQSATAPGASAPRQFLFTPSTPGA
ncbi:type II secretion system protein [Eleftheria terrae]|uniref:type II secretion system protein n=1 Tax=Eleftheria terrae TaxID=1597781 RepID=UPI00263A5036|nr:type II secretion system protein [Eleftheria terrae]WKB56148.1 type II secretion system protein [Eleftheria terrae]